MSTFSKSGYVDYWKERVAQSTDGTKVAGSEVQQGFLELLDLKPGDKVLDLGCSFGRLFPLLAGRTKEVYGMDVDPEALQAAAEQGYVELKEGAAEKTPYGDHFFDALVAWGVYDVVDQEAGLIEANRILKPGGRFLFTGKNHDYLADDRLAFVAERNAFLKDFPNHFTDLEALEELLPQFGFKLVKAFGFERRGDFGQGKYFERAPKDQRPHYEFLWVLEKTADAAPEGLGFCGPHSRTALMAAYQAGHQDMRQYFADHQARNGHE